MENGNGATQPLSVPTSVWPWGVHDVVTAAETVIPGPPPPSSSPRNPRWYETEEGRAKRSVAIKAGWAKRRRRLQAQEQAKAAPVNKQPDIDAAIAYHTNAINTLRAAKALLK